MKKILRKRALLNIAAVFFVCLLLVAGANNINAQNIIVTVAGSGQYGYYGDGGLADTAQLASPAGVCFDKQGNMYIADQANNVIRKVAAGTHIITTIAGTGNPGYYGDAGMADTAELNAPTGVFVDGQGNIFIADMLNNVIREIVDSNGLIITVAGNGDAGYTTDSVPATQSELSAPSAVFVDKAGNIYIADTDNSRVRKVDVNGVIATIAGDTLQGYSGDGGLADTASLNAPDGITVDTAGNIYIADGSNSTIRKVNAQTGIITTLAGSSNNPGYSGDGGLAVNAQLNGPQGLCLDKGGNLYIADYVNNVVRVINAQTGFISTIAGSDTIGYWGDGGLADTARLNGPGGVFVDSTGFLFIADNVNNRIREVGPGLVQWTGVNQLTATVGYSIFPNPCNGKFTITTATAAEDLTLTVYTFMGQQIYQWAIRQAATPIDLGNLASGVYFLRLQTGNTGSLQKIVVTAN